MKGKKLMRKVCLLALFTSALLLSGAIVIGIASPNFSGTWVLDASRSEGQPMTGGSGERIVVISQDANRITVENRFPGGGQERSPGMGGMWSQPMTFNMDGSETTVQMQGQMVGTAKQKAKWLNNGNALELVSVRTLNFGGNEVTITMKDRLEFEGGGAVLVIRRSVQSPRGNQESKLVFTKRA